MDARTIALAQAPDDQDGGSVDEGRAGQRAQETHGVPQWHRRAGCLDAQQLQAVVGHGGAEQTQESPHRGEMDEPALRVPRPRLSAAGGAQSRPWYSQRWFIHFATMWGFLGLLGATMADYGLELLGVKATGAPVPLWYPVRLLGTLAGAALIYGTSVLIVRRLRKSDRSSVHSTTSDWIFLTMLWVAGVTGFALELALYLPSAPTWGYPMFLVHVAVAMALVLLVPFGKFAHVLYRPLALFALRLRG